MTIEEIGARLRKAREERDLSQPQVADIIGTSRQQISIIELGQANVSFDRLEKIAEAVGLEVVLQPRNVTTNSKRDKNRVK
jgi:transcriptional regulator with XRE-family HTH domain